MPFATNAGVRIHWQERGEGTPLLLIMGHRFSGEMWWPVLPAVTPRHRVVWFDNRGTGESDSPATASVAEMVGDAIAVMDAAGIEKAHVFGVSMGGGIAQRRKRLTGYRRPSRTSIARSRRSPRLVSGRQAREDEALAETERCGTGTAPPPGLWAPRD
jgi:alpha/beta hydrolase fold